MGGVGGHAGLFATADDLALFAQTLLDGGRSPSGRRLLAPLTVRAMFDPGTTPAGERRGLGWDVETRYSSPRGAFFGPESLGHTGFTGTSLWIDPETQTFVIILTSHLHPDETHPPALSLRADVSTLVAAAIVDANYRRFPSTAPPDREVATARTDRQGSVRCGIDVLIEDRFATLRASAWGWSRTRPGRRARARRRSTSSSTPPGVKLVKLFSPEHGIRGEVDAAGARRQGRLDGPADRESLRVQEEASAGRSGPTWTRLSSTSRMSARAITLTSPRWGSCSKPSGNPPSGWWCWIVPTRLVAWRWPVRSETTISGRSSPSPPFPSGTA